MPRGRVKDVDLYQVRLYDGFDHLWIDIDKPCLYDEALHIWNEHTKNGTCNTRFADIDYYDIFPADTVMLYSTEGWPEWAEAMDNRGPKGNDETE